jgi:PAS domain-containing protein
VTAIVDAVSDAVVSVDAASLVVLANVTSSRLSGVAGEASIGPPVKDPLWFELHALAPQGDEMPCLSLHRANGPPVLAALSVMAGNEAPGD